MRVNGTMGIFSDAMGILSTRFPDARWHVARAIMIGLFLPAVMAGAARNASAGIIAVEQNRNYYHVDEVTGTATLQGTLSTSDGAPIGPINALARDVNGSIWSVTEIDGTRSLVTIDPVSGIVSSVTAAASAGGIRSLAFSPSNILFGTTNLSGSESLVTIDTATGGVTTVGSIPGGYAIQGLTFVPDGTLYGFAVGRSAGLGTINPLTGIYTDINTSAGAFPEAQSIASNSVGEVFGARFTFNSYDLSTGQVTVINSSPGFSDVRGMEFFSSVPEPNSFALIGVCLGIVGVRRRRRR